MGLLSGYERSSWLGLGEASRLLGITPATLRRWADRGEVAAFVTPGGHRRFSRSVIESLLPQRRIAARPALGLRASLGRMALAYRRARPAPPPGRPWLMALSPAQREDLRNRGHALLDAVLAHLEEAGPESSRDQQQQQARLLATEFGAGAAALGASLNESVEAFLRFRSSFVDELAALARRRRLTTQEATGLLVRAEKVLDRLLLSLIKGHAEALAAQPSPASGTQRP